MTSRRLAPLLLAFAATTALATAPRSARADAPTAADLRKARSQFQRGIELEQASNWSEALQQFREVGAVRMTPQVRFHIAYCEEQLGRLVTALGGYELALGEAEQVGPDFKREVDAAVSGLRARIPKLVIERGTNGEAALVQLDGVDLGGSSVGVEVPLDPGPHTVTANAPGYLQFTTTVELEEREVTHVTLDLTPEPEPQPEENAPVKEVIVVAPPPGPNRTIPYVVGGVGIATLATSGIFFALRQSNYSELKRACPDRNACPESNHDTYERVKTYSVVTPIVASAGAGAIVAATLLIVLEKKPKTDQRGLSVKPDAPGALAGMSVDYHF